MAKFRTSSSEDSKPESIVTMFQDLNRDPSIKFLHFHQGKILEDYCNQQDSKSKNKYIQVKDLAIELPTGTGKTLVGLLIAEYRRRMFHERVVFLCPTRQLCSQVNERARLYGINTALLVGSQSKYDPGQFYAYQQAKSIAITTYSGVFNTNPRINDPEVIVCDDAHAADNYISDFWTLLIDRSKHKNLYMALYRLLEPVMPNYISYKIETGGSSRFDEFSVDLLSIIAWHGYLNQIGQILEEFVSEHDDLKYSWSILASHLETCSLYLSPRSIEVRPLIPPTQTHSPFSNAKQRMYMSATLGEDGDIERVFGVKSIARLPMPEEWHKRSTGRRLILFPDLSANKDSTDTAVSMVKQVDRALILVPDNKRLEVWEKKLKKTHNIVKSQDIEQNLDAFIKSLEPSVLLLATRYDGIDLPGEDCRFMVLDGEPSASGLQEFYLRVGLGASSQLHNRIRTRITQALGRCTRDESDYSVVFVLGDKLTQRCCTKTLTQGMHPELQAEISFGLENSTDHTPKEFVELAQLFLSRSPDWQAAEQDIRKKRDSHAKTPDTTTEYLNQAMPHEIDYVYASWKGQHEDALGIVAKILSALEGGSDLKPYRAFWLHQAAASAFLAWQHSGNETFKLTAISYLDKASVASSNITWLGKLRSELSGQSDINAAEVLPIQEWFLEIDNLLQSWKIVGSNFARKISEVQNNIENKNAKAFEKGLAMLGKMMGAKTYQWEEEAAPDGLWVFGNWHAFVFEAKTNKNPENSISLDDVEQFRTIHIKRVRDDSLIPAFVPCSLVVISPCSTVHRLAEPYVEDTAYLSHDDVIKLFNDAALALERLRALASGSTEEALRENALQFYRERSVALQDIKERLLRRKLRDLPVQ